MRQRPFFCTSWSGRWNMYTSWLAPPCRTLYGVRLQAPAPRHLGGAGKGRLELLVAQPEEELLVPHALLQVRQELGQVLHGPVEKYGLVEGVCLAGRGVLLRRDLQRPLVARSPRRWSDQLLPAQP